MAKGECYRLRDNQSVGVQEARQGDEISFERTLVFRNAGGERLKAGDVRAPAQGYPS